MTHYLVPAAVAATLDRADFAYSAQPCPDPAWSFVTIRDFHSREQRLLFEEAPGVIELVPWEPTPAALIDALGADRDTFEVSAGDSTYRTLKKIGGWFNL